jgi:hypothetical protein
MTLASDLRPMIQSALSAAVFIIGMGSSLALVASLRDLASLESRIVFLVGFFVVFCALRFGGRRGLGALWLLMLVWHLQGLLRNLLNSSHPFLYRALGLPDIFFYSSMLLALPLFFATWVSLHPLPRRANIRFACVTLGWLVLLLSAGIVAAGPPSDVYVPSPVPKAMIAVFGVLVLVPVMLIIPSYFAQLLWKRNV